MNSTTAEKIVKTATIAIVVYLLCFGVAQAFFPIRPFWNDEWRLVYNLKFKNVHQLWGTLDLLQQCPRVYLTLLKKITAFFDYSYTSLRLPALVIGTASVFFVFYLKRKIFPGPAVYGYLFILILMSSQTFTDYLVQVKQYEMELFLCLLALWQLMTLLDISESDSQVSKSKYLLLCLSFAIAPFFSYTYPIAVAPVIFVVVYKSVVAVKSNPEGGKARLLALYAPLAIVCMSIVVFYIIDVRQLMADDRMYLSYRRMLGNEKGENHFIENFWKFFSLVGSGFIFEIVFGLLGIDCFLYGIYYVAKLKMRDYTKQDYFKLYAVLLLAITLCLVFSGKLMGGVARLTAFTVPSISILVVCFLQDLKTKYRSAKLANILAGVVFIGLFGNIISSCINPFTYPEYSNRIKTYWKTSVALKEARLGKMPFLYTEGVRGDPLNPDAPQPGNICYNNITPEQIRGVDRLCTEVIVKVNPEYKAWDTIAVYQIPDMKWVNEYLRQVPGSPETAVVGDGLHFLKLHR